MRTSAVRALGAAVVVLTGAVVRHALKPGEELLGMSDRGAIQHVGGHIAATVVLLWIAYKLVTRSASLAGRKFAAMATIAMLSAVAQGSAAWDGGVQQAASLTPRQREALEFLKRTDEFAMPVVGFGAVPSRGFLAMRELSRSTDRDAAFKDLWRNGRTAGQLYALSGLRRTDRPFFNSAMNLLAQSRESVSVSSGCVTSPEPVASIVRDPRAIRLRERETLEEWIARSNPTKYVPFDLEGGGYTAMFLDPQPGYRELEAEGHRVDFSEAPTVW